MESQYIIWGPEIIFLKSSVVPKNCLKVGNRQVVRNLPRGPKICLPQLWGGPDNCGWWGGCIDSSHTCTIHCFTNTDYTAKKIMLVSRGIVHSISPPPPLTFFSLANKVITQKMQFYGPLPYLFMQLSPSFLSPFFIFVPLNLYFSFLNSGIRNKKLGMSKSFRYGSISE